MVDTTIKIDDLTVQSHADGVILKDAAGADLLLIPEEKAGMVARAIMTANHL